MSIFKNRLQIFLSVLFIGFVAWWVSFQPVRAEDAETTTITWFSDIYFVVALFGVIVGFLAARKWGGFKTTLGKSLSIFSLSLLFQVAGQLIYAYYVNVLHIGTPYPSMGEVAYLGSAFLYCIAAFYLAQTAGISLETKLQKAVAILIPVIWIVISTLILLWTHQFDLTQPLTVFFDIAYPIVDAMYVSVAIVAYVLSVSMLGGTMKRAILLIILALVLAYLADFTFIYQANHGEYISGSYVDLTYLIAYFVMATAMVAFRNIQATALPAANNSTAQPAATTGNEVYNQIARRIIERQESIIGSWAVEQAGRVDGLVVNWPQQVATVSDRPQETIDRLVARYTELFGDTAIKTCKEAVARYKYQIPPDQLPVSLQ